MDEFEIEVIGAGPPRKPDSQLRRLVGQAKRLVRALLMRPRAVVLSALAAFVLFIGTPHGGWDYECRHPMRSGEPCQSYRYCAYYGVQGRRVVFPEDGQSCQLIKFLTIDFGRII